MTGVDPSANAPGFDPARARRRGHVESWFVKLNDPDARRALWLRWTLSAAPGEPARAECWAVAFERGRAPRAAKRSGPLADAMLARAPFGVDFPWGSFDGRRAVGRLPLPASSGGGELAWDVELVPRVPTLRPLPFAWLYKSPLAPSVYITPVPDADVKGSIVFDGVRTDVAGWRGAQGHNWGRRQPHRYAWCQAAGFEGADDVAFESICVRLARGSLELPWLTFAHVWLGDRWLRFDRPRSVVGGRVDTSVMRTSFATRTDGFELEVSAHAEPREAAGLHYANPGGPLLYCLNSKLASLEVRLRGPGTDRTLRTERAALELGWPTADHGVGMLA